MSNARLLTHGVKTPEIKKSDRKSIALDGLWASLVIFAALLAGQASGSDYYVSITGSDTMGNGSLANPYRTIQMGANMASSAGDTVYVRGGTYRETVTMGHSGTGAKPITFCPYNSERVTVTGLDVLSSSGWSNYSGSIYKATVTGGASQLFVNGQMMTEARFPNAGYNNPLHAAMATTTSAQYQALPALSTITDSSRSGTPNGQWNNAKLVINGSSVSPGYRWTYLSRQIVNQTGGMLNYAAGLEEQTPYLQPTAKGGDPYYITGSLAALNAPKEWYYGADSNLYLQAPNSVNPATLTVEARQRQYGFDFNNQSCVQLKGFCMKAANVKIDSAGNHNRIDNCQILYPTPYTEPTHFTGASGVEIAGQYNTISNSEIAYSWGDGVTLKNSNNTVSNNVIHDVDWAGNEGGCVNTSQSGGNNTITGNTMYNSGRQGVLLNSCAYGKFCVSDNTTITHNDISRFAALTGDCAGIYAFNADAPGTTIAYNRIDSGSGSLYRVGIYMDDSTNRSTIHHNLVKNGQTGIFVKGYSQNVYNNTIWGASGAAVRGNETTSDTNVMNNLSNNSNFSTDFSSDGNTVSNNRYQTVTQFTNSAVGDYTLTANSSGTRTGPTYKRAKGYGTPIDGITPGGNATPDVGAFQSGETPWNAGASFRTWLAGNQVAATLTDTVNVNAANVRTTTGPLIVGKTSTNQRSFLKFDTSDVSGVIESAVLRIYENQAPSSIATGVSLYACTSNWNSGNVIYDQGISSAITSSFYDPANLDLYTDIDVTATVQGWVRNPSSNYGFSLRSNAEDADSSAKYFDGLYGVTAPQLIITTPEPSVLSLLLSAALTGVGVMAWVGRTRLAKYYVG